MIPKVIHYCWFGGNKKPKLMKKCIKSWKKYCPDYEIIEWNEKNYDIQKSCDYVQEAYREKKWAFVTDFVRLDIVYKYGGIYLDTDVELLKKLDVLLTHPAFFGFQDDSHIATGLGFGAEQGNEIVRKMLEDYQHIHFVDKEGNVDITPCTVRNTQAVSDLLIDIDLTVVNNLLEGVLYPKEYFSPIDCKTLKMEMTENTISIHWFNASWRDDDYLIPKEYNDFYEAVSKKLGERSTYAYVTIYYYLFRNRKWKYLQEKWRGSLITEVKNERK